MSINLPQRSITIVLPITLQLLLITDIARSDTSRARNISACMATAKRISENKVRQGHAPEDMQEWQRYCTNRAASDLEHDRRHRVSNNRCNIAYENEGKKLTDDLARHRIDFATWSQPSAQSNARLFMCTK